MTGAQVALAVYALGVVIALVRTDSGWGSRVLLAGLWPIGPLAFALTVTALLAIGMVAFPMFGIAVVTLAGAAWYLL
jgi:hypothetical protein